MTMHQITLPSRLDTPASQPLAAEMLGPLEAGGSVELVGSAVDLVGMACLQVLAGARRMARSHGADVLIISPSDALIDGCVLAGLEALVRPA